MKKNIVYGLCLICLFASCSSAYRSSQTPDDVYYSPGQRASGGYTNNNEYQSYGSSADDQYLRMEASNYSRFGNLDDFSYWNDSRYLYNSYPSFYSGYGLGLGFGSGFYSPYSSFYSPFSSFYSPFSPMYYNPWNSWYSPAYTVVYYKNPTAYYNTGRSQSTLSTYNNRTYNRSNMPLQTGRASSGNISGLTRRNNNMYSNPVRTNNFSNPTRTFNNSNNSSRSFNMGSSNNFRSSGGGGGGMMRSARGH